MNGEPCPRREASPRSSTTVAVVVTTPMLHASGSLVMTACGASDRGFVRAANEDQFSISSVSSTLWVEQSSLAQPRVRCSQPIGHLLVVADGVGGGPGGAEASALAVETVEQWMLDAAHGLSLLTAGGVLQQLERAVLGADAAVRAKAAEAPALRAMATTLTIAYSLGAQLSIAHVGDSRCCLLRDGALRRLTRDQTVFQDLVDAGLLVDGAREDASRHMLTNAVGGGNEAPTVELRRMALVAGDVVLLCSDGLHGAVDDEEIAAILSGESIPERACDELVHAANDAGGRDNVTVVVARYEDGGW